MTVRPIVIFKVALGASAIAFACLLVLFVVILFAKDIDAADMVWRQPWPAVAWLAALGVCLWAGWFRDN